MITSFKTGLMAAAAGAILGLSAFSAGAAPLQSSAVEQPAAERTAVQGGAKLQHDRRTTGSIGQRNTDTDSTMPYMMRSKKPLNMDCKLGFNPTSSSSCNY